MRPIEETGELRIAQIRRNMVPHFPEGYKMLAKVPGWRWRQWVADWCWNILMRLRALDQFMYREEVATYTEAEAQQVTDALMYDISRVIREYANARDEFVIVMGGETFREFCHWYQADFRMMPVPMSRWNYRDDSRGIHAEYNGTPVYVIPWLKGCAVLPKAIIVKEVDDSDRWSEARDRLAADMFSAGPMRRKYGPPVEE